MTAARRKFQRPLGERRYRKLFVIATEGYITEPQYFALFLKYQPIVHIKCLRDKSKNSPLQVLKRLRTQLKNENFMKSDEAWLVVDKDKWTDNQLGQLFAWSNQSDQFGFALSNPKFEFWLLLHFEDGNGIASSQDCSGRLQVHLPDYDKNIDSRKFTRELMEVAIHRAEVRDNPPCADWPKVIGTTVYKLVAKFLSVN
ncbi:MAG: RloB domain-containing protein [Porphyromonadaceae bacterium]|nr:MAG: RloB domain-containing protein [Porphyromonadaceae bacterium]